MSGREIDLTTALPKGRRDVAARAAAKCAETIRVAKTFGEAYFDGPRAFGYGGYRYDGRWIPVAQAIIAHFGLRPGDRVLDVGCAKGFLVKDLRDACPGLEVWGVDISAYAVGAAHAEARPYLAVASADALPFEAPFDAVLALDVIHNLPRAACARALSEIQRLSAGRAYVRVDSYRTPAEKAAFEAWVLTAEHHDAPAGWRALFAEAGYSGDYSWTIIS